MSRSKNLNRRQRWRIEKIQQERIERASKRALKADAELLEGDLSDELEGIVIQHFGTQIEVEALPHQADSDTIRCHLRANLPSLVTGDKVVWRSGQPTGVVVACHPRQNELCRPDKYGNLKPVAANIDQIIIVIAPAPQPHANLIDRYLIAAEHSGIKPLLLLNKTDLVNADNRNELDALLSIYPRLGYPVIHTSTRDAASLQHLQTILQNRISVFVGQSGVGKSSLINELLPGVQQRIGALSEKTAKGTHTTTSAQLFHFPSGGELIDSPGIREFGLHHLEENDIAAGFVEFQPFLGHCRFRDCQHREEPGCALLAAIEDGHIAPHRFASYQRIVADSAAFRE